MPGFSNYLEKNIRALLLGNQLWAGRPSTFYLGLHSADPTDGTPAENLIASTEISGKGYLRIPIACNNTNWTVSKDTVTLAVNVTGSANATADWGNITHWSLWDKTSQGNLLFSGAVSDIKPIVIYGSAGIDAGTITITLGGAFGIVAATAILRYLFQLAAWTNIPTLYFGAGTNADSAQLYGEPVAIEGASATGYIRGTLANATAKFPTSTASPSSTTNAVAITNFATATADLGTLSYQAMLDNAIIIGKTWTQSTTTVTIASVAHGLGATSTLPSNSKLGSLSGTYTIATNAVTVTLPVGHGFNAGDLVCLTYAGGGSATSGRFTILTATATTITVTDVGAGGTTPGTVTIAWPLYVDVWFLSASTSVFPTSKRYVVNSITSADAFTIVADISQTVTTSNCVYSAANVIGFAALTTPISVDATATSSIPASAITANFD